MPLLLLKYWKYIAGAALLALIWWQVHSFGLRRYEAGQAKVQARWDADELAEKAVADKQIADNRLAESAAAARNKEIDREHAQKLAAAAADTDRLRRLLASAREAAGRGGAAPDPDLPTVAPASSPGENAGAGQAVAGIAERVDSAIADALTEARMNADQLDALIGQIRTQILPASQGPRDP